MHDYHQTLTHKSAICSDNQYSYDIYSINPDNYPLLEDYALNILYFLQLKMRIQLTMIAVDFIKT